jgi:hypothetical protein
MMVIKIFQNIDKSGERSKTADGYDVMINMIKKHMGSHHNHHFIIHISGSDCEGPLMDVMK